MVAPMSPGRPARSCLVDDGELSNGRQRTGHRRGSFGTPAWIFPSVPCRECYEMGRLAENTAAHTQSKIGTRTDRRSLTVS